jgi:DNA-binding transcriptional LysR family regulator
LTTVIGIIRSAWPGMRVTLRFAESPLAASLVDTDLIAWFGVDAPPGAWTCHTIAPTPLRLLASPAYLSEHGRPTTVAQLAEHDLFMWLGAGEREPALVTRGGDRVAVPWVTASGNVDLLHSCARRGLGLAWTPDGGLPALEGEVLVPLLDAELGAPCELRIAAPAALASIPRVQAVLSNLALIRSASTKAG